MAGALPGTGGQPGQVQGPGPQDQGDPQGEGESTEYRLTILNILKDL